MAKLPEQHQISARVGGDTFHTFASLAAILGQTHAETLDRAIAALVATLPAATRRAIEASTRAAKEHCHVCRKSRS